MYNKNFIMWVTHTRKFRGFFLLYYFFGIFYEEGKPHTLYVESFSTFFTYLY